MKNRTTKRGVASLLILFAMLFVGVATFLPTLASADPAPAAAGGEIEDFYYQTLIGADVKDSVKTDLRFLFSVGSLAYDAVGFVFSTSDSDPVKADTPKVNYKSVTKVYGAVTANGDERPAPAGRYWVAVKLTDIPHDSFATYIYIRPFVQDGSGTRYGETKRINVCEALGHVHEIKNPTGTATLLTPGTRCGNCPVCNINGIVEEDVYAAVADTVTENRYQAGNYPSTTFEQGEHFNDVLLPGETYYPDPENNNEGRDFYYEIDVLWNQTMANSVLDEFRFSLYSTVGKYNRYCSELFRFTPKNGSSSRNKYAGGFDFDTATAVVSGPAGGDGEPFDYYPNLNDSSSESDWGWHKIGVRIHESAETDGVNVTYTVNSFLYIDGEERWKIKLDTSVLNSRTQLFYTMDTSKNYTADLSNNLFFSFNVSNLNYCVEACYLVTANLTAHAVIPSEFSTGVVPVADPVDSKYVLMDDIVIPAKVYFAAAQN